MKKKITTIGGGTGQYVLLSGLRDLENVNITAIVSMMDSGGSTGRLRDELGILPPGDIMKCVLAMAENREPAREILQKRFMAQNRLNGHSLGNMLLTILSQYTGSFPDGVKALGEALGVKGDVLPVTIDKATLVAELTDGSRLYGESAIDIPRGNQREKINRTFLVPHHSDVIRVYPPVIEAIENADYIIVGPGDLYTSILPNLLVSGVKEAMQKTKAKLIYVVNVMTKYGETDNFTGNDFVSSIEENVGRKMDVAIFNSARPDENILKEYEKQKSSFIEIDINDIDNGRTIIKEDLLNSEGDLARHNSEKLARQIDKLINNS